MTKKQLSLLLKVAAVLYGHKHVLLSHSKFLEVAD